MPIRALTAVLALVLASPPAAAAGSCSVASSPRQLPLVELYTSEGCSDCPPADKWLKRLVDEPAMPLAALAFHVDYWDDLGWVDRFGLPMNSQRQKARIGWAKSKALVTPAVMIGERVMVEWRSQSAVDALLAQAGAKEAQVDLDMTARQEGDVLRVDFQATPKGAIASPAYVWLALYQDGLSSAVQAGENKRVTLHHDRVVRALEGPWRLDAKAIAGDSSITLPPDGDPARMGVVLFAESGVDGASLQALELPLASCR